jgi:fructose/tagatose bisphosphate aldolase
MLLDEVRRVAQPLKDAIEIDDDLNVHLKDLDALRSRVEQLVRTAVLGSPREKGLARWLIRMCALEAGVIPSSIHELYLARGRGETRDDFTVPAMNLRALSFLAARSVYRAAASLDAKAMIFEIARSEIGYTDQRPTEYASTVLGAALAEGYQGPVFIQGDHFQVSASRYQKDPDGEVQAVRNIAEEAIAAGFFNIDIDTSTLVDLSKETIDEQQTLNYSLCAELSKDIRQKEPEGITISLGGEIGEVGGQNSTEPELRGFMHGFNEQLEAMHPGAAGLSKISIQTGTSHGGVVLPDGSIAEVSVDFETLEHLSKVAKEFGMGGAVQHGASTLPEEAFTRFSEAGALEVHLATNFQNMLYDRIPKELEQEIHAYLEQNHADERKSDQTDEQFFYKTRKRAIGPFKEQLWNLPQDVLEEVESAWNEQFNLLFERLNIGGTSEDVEKHIKPVKIYPNIEHYLEGDLEEAEVEGLAD